MASSIDAAALDQLFRTARTHNKFLDKEVPDSLLKQVVDLAQFGRIEADLKAGIAVADLTRQLEGAVPEPMLLAKLQEAAALPSKQ